MDGWRYNAGLALILVVVLIWVASAEVTQDIFTGYDHPFTITWLGASLLTLLLPIAWLKDRCRPRDKAGRSSSTSRRQTPTAASGETFVFSPHAHSSGGVIGRRDLSPTRAGIRNGGDVELQPFLKKEKEKERDTDAKPDDSKTILHLFVEKLRDMKKVVQSSAWEVARIGFFLAPLWFVTEYFANASLALTSVANTTILSSSAGLWTLLFSIALGQETFNCTKLVAVVVTIGGVAMTTLGQSWTTPIAGGDPKDTTKPVPDARLPGNIPNDNLSAHTLMGDALSLTSAICYGLFTVQLKRFAGEDVHTGETADVQRIFGYIGLFTLLGLWWLVLPLHALGIEPAFHLPNSLRLDEALLANGLVGSMVSDYFWALAVVWTTPIVATLGMSLTIPVAMVSDVILHARHFSSIYILGAIQVFAGFCIANLDDKWMQKLGFQ